MKRCSVCRKTDKQVEFNNSVTHLCKVHYREYIRERKKKAGKLKSPEELAQRYKKISASLKVDYQAAGNPNARLSWVLVYQIRQLAKMGYSCGDIKKRLNLKVSKQAIFNVINNVSWVKKVSVA